MRQDEGLRKYEGFHWINKTEKEIWILNRLSECKTNQLIGGIATNHCGSGRCTNEVICTRPDDDVCGGHDPRISICRTSIKANGDRRAGARRDWAAEHGRDCGPRADAGPECRRADSGDSLCRRRHQGCDANTDCGDASKLPRESHKKKIFDKNYPPPKFFVNNNIETQTDPSLD